MKLARQFGRTVAVIESFESPHELVFHRPRRSPDGAAGDHAVCGRLVARAARLHIVHAARCARPCRQCWRVMQLDLFDREAA